MVWGRHRYGIASVAVATVVGCIEPPEVPDTSASGSLPGLLTDGEPFEDLDGGLTEIPDPDPDGSGAPIPDDAGSDSAAGVTTFDPVPETTTATGGETGSAPPTGQFPEPGVFGDDIRETDIVGIWGTPWDPVGVADVTLTIASNGEFTWRETSSDCSSEAIASGVLWVEATQLVMHIDSWDKRRPWATGAAIGEVYDPPFRMRLGYAPMGEFLSVAGPSRLMDLRDWDGRSYDRIEAGIGPAGSWISEAELWAIPVGQTEPQLIVRDRFTAELQGLGDATVVHQRQYWWPELAAAETVDEQAGIWFDETEGNVAGAAVVAGTRHAYDAVHMLSFVSGMSFRTGVASDCP